MSRVQSTGVGKWRLARFIASWMALLLWASPSLRAEVDIRHDATVDAVKSAIPSVVNIGTESLVEVHDRYEDAIREFYNPFIRVQPQYQWQHSLGSGVIIDEDGYILTNFHVVTRARRIQVKLCEDEGGKEYEAEMVMGAESADLALLKIILPAKEKGTKFKAIRLAKDDDLLLGETVLALGNPFGLGGSVSRGILSSKQRSEVGADGKLETSNFIQTDASINPGNSGGPIINMHGELIGISTAILQGAQGIGFAIPVKDAREALSKIFIPESNSRWFGARVKAGSAPLMVDWVDPTGPASKAGLRVGDEILQVNGKTPKGFEFNRWLRDDPKPEFMLTVQRGGERLDIDIRLVTFAEMIHRRLGLDVQELTGPLAKQFGLQDHAGLLISRVEKGGPAEKAELKPYYLITALDSENVNQLINAVSVIYRKKRDDVVEMSVLVPQTQGDVIVGYQRGVTQLKLR